MLRSPAEHELPALSLGMPALSYLQTRPASCQAQRSADSGPAQFAEATRYHQRTASDLSQAEFSDMETSVGSNNGSPHLYFGDESAMIRPLTLRLDSISRSSGAFTPVKRDVCSSNKRRRTNMCF